MIKVLLVDDNASVRESIKYNLDKHPKIQIIGECKDGKEVIPFLQRLKPDVILMDYRMPILNGIETTKLVKDLFPKIKVIGFSCNDDIITKEAFLKNGAAGFLSKYETDNDVLVLEINNCCSTVKG